MAAIARLTGRARIVLVADSLRQPAWIASMLREVQASDAGELVALVLLEAAPTDARCVLHKAYDACDHRVADGPDPSAGEDVTPLIGDVAVWRAAAAGGPATLPVVAQEWVRAQSPDVVLSLAAPWRASSLRACAPHGMWAYHFADPVAYAGTPPAFWEVADDCPVTGIALRRCGDPDVGPPALAAEPDPGETLVRSWTATNRYSVRKSHAAGLWKGARLVVRALQALHDPAAAARATSAVASANVRDPGLPGNGAVALTWARLLARRASARARRALVSEQWMLGIHAGDAGVAREHPGAALVAGGPLPPITPIIPPRDRIWADPFPIVRGGTRWIFFEEKLRGASRAHLVVGELADRGFVEPPRVIMQRDIHLSYPHVFEWSGELFMIPETSRARRVELYRATRAPHEWTLEAVLLSGVRAWDATVHERDGRWWMFANAAEHATGGWDELWLWSADSPLGPWTAVPRNPVKSDVRSARPAGRLFESGGRLYRPAQDCSARYGGAMVLHEVTRLDPDGFDERAVARVEARWAPGLVGTHTINWHGGLLVLDGMQQRWRLAARA